MKIIYPLKPKMLAKILQLTLNIGLMCLATLLIIFLIKETWVLISILLFSASEHANYLMIEAVIVWFLYFEFIALISKYFKAKYHFPLRYFIYIGITAIIRLIIIDHAKPLNTLIYAFSILVLILALYIANTQLLKRI